jgi:hypothetical protein
MLCKGVPRPSVKKRGWPDQIEERSSKCPRPRSPSRSPASIFHPAPSSVCATNLGGIADTLEEWFVEGAADGYNILPAYFPGAFADFVDLVVPELQHRGLLRRDYEGQTLRDHLGLARAAAPARLRQAAGAE